MYYHKCVHVEMNMPMLLNLTSHKLQFAYTLNEK